MNPFNNTFSGYKCNIVLGVNEDGYREIFGFYVGGQESALGWQEILQDLYQCGVKCISDFVHDTSLYIGFWIDRFKSFRLWRTLSTGKTQPSLRSISGSCLGSCSR
jgi:hypothetical protein